MASLAAPRRHRHLRNRLRGIAGVSGHLHTGLVRRKARRPGRGARLVACNAVGAVAYRFWLRQYTVRLAAGACRDGRQHRHPGVGAAAAR